MNLHPTILAVSLALLSGNVAAQLPNPSQTGALPVPANRIAGLWATTVTIGPCQGGPTTTFGGASVFHAGGTMGETNMSSPTTRGPAQGIWKHEGRNQYKTRFQFFAYLPDGTYDGVRQVTTTTFLNPHANRYDATVRARLLNPDGSLRVELCGNAVGERIGFN